jgi:predicted glycogen debranching enzyme
MKRKVATARPPFVVPRPAPTSVPAEVCTDYPRASRLEWLLANGRGGFAMGTVSGANTRRYHGLLVASLHPPVQRVVTLSRLEETVHSSAGEFPLSVNQYPGTLHPDGYRRLTGFRLDPDPVWTWDVGGVRVEKRVRLLPGEQTVLVQYSSSASVRLRIEPLLAFRDYHSLAHRNPVAWSGVEEKIEGDTRRLRFQPYDTLPSLWLVHSGGSFSAAPAWHDNVEYLEELDRGLDFREDLLVPGSFLLELDATSPGFVGATLDPSRTFDSAAAARSFSEASARPVRTEVRTRLDAAAETYLVQRADRSATIIAGYPWFTDWGRDTMISLPGLVIARGQLDIARQVLEGFLKHLDGGLVPNRFPDAAGPAEYNSADATLWMFQAVHALERAGGASKFLGDTFYPAALTILDAHQRGTHHGIRVDPVDGLLIAGDAGSNLTWMDARVDGAPVTPRHGKPVEINALWFNALRLTASWAQQLGDERRKVELEREAERVRTSFDRAFWNEQRGACFDVILPEGRDGRMRPNQVLALGLPFPLLDAERRHRVLSAVESTLLTPVGLRTLAPGDPGYRPVYRGGPSERDRAYHQGLVWPWLIGPYVDALFAVRGESAGTQMRARSALASLLTRLDAGCLGQLPECFEPEPPFRAVCAPAQAWSVAEVLRVLVRLETVET